MSEPSGFNLVSVIVGVAVFVIAPAIIGNSHWLPLPGSWADMHLNYFLYAVCGIFVLVVHALLDASDRRSAKKKLNHRQRKRQRRMERRAIEANAPEPNIPASSGSNPDKHERSAEREDVTIDENQGREPEESGTALKPHGREMQ